MRFVWPLLAVLVLTALRLPFLADAPVNWDSVQFAMAIQQYDLAFYQPHPPGYILYVALGTVVNAIVGDPNLTLALISAAASAIAIPLMWGLAGSMGLRPLTRAVVTGFFAVSPLSLYYGSVALTYAPEAALALGIAWLLWHAVREQDPRTVLLAALLLAVAGGVRQTSLLLLLPLWLWSAGRVGLRTLAIGAGLLAAGVLLWLVPLLVLSGGIEEYLAITRFLAREVLLPDSRDGGLTMTAINFGYFIVAILAGLGVAVVWALAAMTRLRRPGLRGAFLLVWITPPLLLFAFAHIGQPGYFLLVLPAVLLAVGALLDDRFPTPGLGRLPTVPAAAGLVGLALVANLALWFASARALDRIVQIPGPVREIRETLTGYVPLYGLLPSRIDWPLLRSRLDQYAPGEVMLMTSAGILGPFRHLQYYYPDHSLHGIWMTPDDGWFFRSILPSGPYGPGEARVPVASIPVPEGVRAIVVIDNPFVECLSQRGPVRVERIGGDHRMYTLTSVTDRELRLTTDCLGNAPPEPD